MIVILLLGLIIINEKKKDFLIPKIEKQITSYLEENYQNETKDFTYSNLKRKNDSYTLKVKNSSNKNLYFIVIYKNNKITDTYKKDYLEGNTLNNYMSKKMNDKINSSINITKSNYIKYTISYNTKLNDCTNNVKEKLLSKDYNQPIYTINIETEYQDSIELKTILANILEYTNTLNLRPKNYNITLNNEKNLTKSMNLIIDNDIMVNSIDEVVQVIMSNDKTLLQKYNIKLKYLN